MRFRVVSLVTNLTAKIYAVMAVKVLMLVITSEE
jgi:hypothetical protein